jgi:hypothetical protein
MRLSVLVFGACQGGAFLAAAPLPLEFSLSTLNSPFNIMSSAMSRIYKRSLLRNKVPRLNVRETSGYQRHTRGTLSVLRISHGCACPLVHRVLRRFAILGLRVRHYEQGSFRHRSQTTTSSLILISTSRATVISRGSQCLDLGLGVPVSNQLVSRGVIFC